MVTNREFFKLLGESNLLGRVMFAVARKTRGDDVGAIAAKLVRKGLLTEWQAQQLIAGKNAFLLGRYKLLDKIGEGGMGTVFKAEHVTTKRIAALKVIVSKLQDKPAALNRFRREMQAIAALDHPNIVRAYDADTIESISYLVMEYVDGSDLEKWIAEFGRLPIDWSCECIKQAALGLEHAHETGLVHRDLKPSNLLVVGESTSIRPKVKILDLGLARFVDIEEDERLEGGDNEPAHVAEDGVTVLTEIGHVLGTADYISPEQFRFARDADIRSDIYSLGCTLFQMITGEPVYPDKDPTARLHAKITVDTRPCSTVRDEVPPELDRIIATMLARDPDDRYQHPRELAVALAPFSFQGETSMQEPLCLAQRKIALSDTKTNFHIDSVLTVLDEPTEGIS